MLTPPPPAFEGEEEDSPERPPVPLDSPLGRPAPGFLAFDAPAVPLTNFTRDSWVEKAEERPRRSTARYSDPAAHRDGSHHRHHHHDGGGGGGSGHKHRSSEGKKAGGRRRARQETQHARHRAKQQTEQQQARTSAISDWIGNQEGGSGDTAHL